MVMLGSSARRGFPSLYAQHRRNTRRLLNRVRSGDREAFDELYRLNHDRLRGILRERVDSDAEAEKATGQVFAALWRDLGRDGLQDESLTGWVDSMSLGVVSRR